jgi:hypothetical protein
MRANRKSGVPSEVEAIKTNPLLSQASHPRRPSFPTTLFENMDTWITCSRTLDRLDGARKPIAEKHMQEAKILGVVE